MPVERLRGNERRRTGQVMGGVFRKPWAIGQTEVEQAQLAVCAQVQILGLDIPMQQVAPVQHADCLQQLTGDFQPLRQG